MLLPTTRLRPPTGRPRPRRAGALARLAALAFLPCFPACGEPPDPEYLRAVSELLKSDHVDLVDPETCRAGIETIEASLFRDDALTSPDREVLGREFSGLGRRILDAGPTALGKVFGRELIVLGKRVASSGDPVTRTRESTRLQWQRIRSSLFSDASWFR